MHILLLILSYYVYVYLHIIAVNKNGQVIPHNIRTLILQQLGIKW